MALVSCATVTLDTRAVRAQGLVLWVTELDSELNAQTTLTQVLIMLDPNSIVVFF